MHDIRQGTAEGRLSWRSQEVGQNTGWLDDRVKYEGDDDQWLRRRGCLVMGCTPPTAPRDNGGGGFQCHREDRFTTSKLDSWLHNPSCRHASSVIMSGGS